ncbi:MAG: endo-1,4-beta-xylanase [Polyangiales bacterium]
MDPISYHDLRNAVQLARVVAVASLAAFAACSSQVDGATQGTVSEAGGSRAAATAGVAATSGGGVGAPAGAGRSAPVGQGDAGRSAGQAGASASGGAGSAATAGAGAAAGAGASASVAGASAQAGADAASAGQAGGVVAGTSASGAGAPAAGSSAPTPGKKFVGNITTRGQVRPDFVMYWDQITPENEGKWGSVEGTRDQMNWAPLDAVHAYAKANNLPFKQHTLVWGSQQPGWLEGLSADEQRAEVEEWIRLFCERYPDTQLIDVVNEPPPHTMPVYMEALGGAGSSGYDWIVQSFKWARQYCPNAILILNDYNNIEYGGDNTHFLEIVNALKSAGAPIDALGAQAHDVFKLPVDTVRGFLDKLADTGLPVYISEYDINLASDDEQRKVMEAQFPLFWEHEHVAGITLWGYVAGATWRTDTGLMQDGGAKRPALTWLLEFLTSQR